MEHAEQAGRATPWRRISVAAAVWAVVVAAVLVAAALMTDHPKDAEAPSAPAPNLPPLSLTLDRDLPAAATKVDSGEEQIEVLQERAANENTPAAWVDLGAVRHYQGNYQGALLDYRRALALDPDRLDAQVGILMIEAATASGRERAAPALAELAARYPTSQLVAFNQGMVAIYREDPATARAAFRRVTALGARTPLGVVAARLAAAASGGTTTAP